MSTGRWHKLHEDAVLLCGPKQRLIAYVYAVIYPSAGVRELQRLTDLPYRACLFGVNLRISQCAETGSKPDHAKRPPEQIADETRIKTGSKPDQQMDQSLARARAVVDFGSLTATTETTLSGSRRKKSPAPLMSDFTITTGMRAWFKGQFGEVPEREVLGETESFLDHHRAKGNLMVDWAAAWRTWMRNWRTRFGATNGKLGTKRAEVSPTSREGIRARWGNPTWMKEEPDGK